MRLYGTCARELAGARTAAAGAHARLSRACADGHHGRVWTADARGTRTAVVGARGRLSTDGRWLPVRAASRCGLAGGAASRARADGYRGCARTAVAGVGRRPSLAHADCCRGRAWMAVRGRPFPASADGRLVSQRALSTPRPRRECMHNARYTWYSPKHMMQTPQSTLWATCNAIVVPCCRELWQ